MVTMEGAHGSSNQVDYVLVPCEARHAHHRKQSISLLHYSNYHCSSPGGHQVPLTMTNHQDCTAPGSPVTGRTVLNHTLGWPLVGYRVNDHTSS